MVFAPLFTKRRSFREARTNDRDWLFRLAFQVGHHLIAREALQVPPATAFPSSLPFLREPKNWGMASEKKLLTMGRL